MRSLPAVTKLHRGKKKTGGHLPKSRHTLQIVNASIRNLILSLQEILALLNKFRPPA